MEFSRQEYWSGLHFFLQGIFLTQGSNQGLLHCRHSLPSEPPCTCFPSPGVFVFSAEMRNHFIANGEVKANGKKGENSLLKEINPEYSLEGLRLSSSTLATWCEEPTHWKKPWANSRRSLWRTGKPGMLQSMGLTKSQTWLTEQQFRIKEGCYGHVSILDSCT